MRRLFLLTSLLVSTFGLNAQTAPPNNEAEFRAQYERRIRQTYLNGVYIPKDLTDAFIQFNRLIDKDSKDKFISVPDTIAARKLHFSLGRWVTTNWGLYEGSRLSVFLNQLDLYHPDDMARFLIITYHRNLRRVPLDVKTLITELTEQRKELETNRKLKGEVLHEEVKKSKQKQ